MLTISLLSRSKRRTRGALLGALLAALAVAEIACSDHDGGGGPNAVFAKTPPATRVLEVSATVVDDVPAFRVRWRGTDDDGAIAGFEYALDEPANWIFTDRDEVILAVGDAPRAGAGASLAAGGRPLFVRAVDDDGLRDPSPARVTLGGENAPPVTVITGGPGVGGAWEIVGTCVALDWSGDDPDGAVTGYRYRLDAEPWVEVDADCTRVRVGGLGVARFPGDSSGVHRFQVVSVDDDGAVEQAVDAPRNMRQWESVRRAPTVRIVSDALGSRTGEGDLAAAVFEGTPLAFAWRARAEGASDAIECYTFSFDGAPDSPCDAGNTRFPPDGSPFVPALGAHRLRVTARDDCAEFGSASFLFDVVPGPGGIDVAERRVLYVDDFDLGSGSDGTAFPTDPEEDAFWESVLAGVPRTTFDVEAASDIPPLSTIGAASTIIWYVDDESELGRANDPSDNRNPLWAYARAGGNVILCGFTPTGALTPDNTFVPIEIEQPGCRHRPRNTYGGAESSLDWYPAPCDTIPFPPVYDFLRVRRSFYDGGAGNLARLRAESPLVPDLALDPTKRGTLPDGTPLLAAGLERCEQFELCADAARLAESAIPLWRFVDVNGLEQRVCGFWIPASAESGRGHVVVLGFAPYFFDTLGIRAVMRTLLQSFGQPMASGE